MINKFKILLTVLLMLATFYGGFYYTFLKEQKVDTYPYLRARLGTVLWHSSDQDALTDPKKLAEHLYCYYPKDNAMYNNRSGEYILKRADKISDCTDWRGAVVFKEAWWVSEKEKLWWSHQQQLADLEYNDTL